MAFQKGHTKVGGRKANTPNKVTVGAKKMLEAVHARIGGEQAMTEWAAQNQTEFYKLWSKILPQEVTGENGGPITFEKIERVIRGNSRD